MCVCVREKEERQTQREGRGHYSADFRPEGMPTVVTQRGHNETEDFYLNYCFRCLDTVAKDDKRQMFTDR